MWQHRKALIAILGRYQGVPQGRFWGMLLGMSTEWEHVYEWCRRVYL